MPLVVASGMMAFRPVPRQRLVLLQHLLLPVRLPPLVRRKPLALRRLRGHLRLPALRRLQSLLLRLLRQPPSKRRTLSFDTDPWRAVESYGKLARKLILHSEAIGMGDERSYGYYNLSFAVKWT